MIADTAQKVSVHPLQFLSYDAIPKNATLRCQ